MSQQFLQILSSLLVGGIGAAVAGYMGVKFGLSKLAVERGFTRRVDWYETSISELQNTFASLRLLSVYLHDFTSEDEYPQPLNTMEILASLQQVIPKLVGGAQAYAPAETYEVVIKATSDVSLVTIVLPHTVRPDMPENVIRHSLSQMVGIVGTILQHLIFRLTSDLRELIQLDKLNEHKGAYGGDEKEFEAMRKKLHEIYEMNKKNIAEQQTATKGT